MARGIVIRRHLRRGVREVARATKYVASGPPPINAEGGIVIQTIPLVIGGIPIVIT